MKSPARAGLMTALGAGLAGIATLAANELIAGTYARLLVTAIPIAAAIVAILAWRGRLVRARNVAGLVLWLIAGAGFAHATEPGVGADAGLIGVVSLLPAAALTTAAIRSASIGSRPITRVEVPLQP